MIEKKKLVEKMEQAKKLHAEACERGNGLVAEYYEGAIDTLSYIIDLLATEDE